MTFRTRNSHISNRTLFHISTLTCVAIAQIIAGPNANANTEAQSSSTVERNASSEAFRVNSDGSWSDPQEEGAYVEWLGKEGRFRVPVRLSIDWSTRQTPGG